MEPPRREQTHWDRISALAATVTAVVAVVIAAYTAYLQRKQTMAAVWPHAEAGWAWGNGAFVAHVTNKGIGPAILVSTDVTFDGRKTRTWLDFFRKAAADANAGATCRVNEITGMVLMPGQDATAMTCALDGKLRHTLLMNIVKADITICYCSIYEECWVASNHSGTASVRECPARGPDAFKDLDHDELQTIERSWSTDDAGAQPVDAGAQ